MATNYCSNPNGTVNTTGWYTSGSCAVSSTADGLRLRKTTTGSGDLTYDDGGTAPGGFRYSIYAIRIRRNTSASGVPQSLRLAVYTNSGWVTVDVGLTPGVFPVGEWVVIPVVKNTGLSKAGGGFYVQLYGGGTYDITIKGVGVFKQTELDGEGLMASSAILDADDAAFVATVPNNSLTGTFQHSNPNEFVDALKWDWGHGGQVTGPASAATSRTKTHAFPTAGTYLVKLTGTNFAGQTYTTQQNVTVPSGVFDAAYNHTASYLDLDVDATPSVGAVVSTYLWAWGDGTTTSGASKFATHHYALAGTYNVSLTISNSLGQSNTETKTIVVTAPPNPDIFFTDNKNLLAVSFFPSKQDGTTYSWNFGDGQTSTVKNATHTYATAGTYTVTLVVNGTLTATRSITVTEVFTPIGNPADALRLEIQQKPGEDVIWNRLPNPNGEQGAFGWSTPVNGSSIDASNTATGPNDHGFAGWKLWYASSGATAQVFYSAAVSVQAGKYVAAALSVPYTEAYHRLTVEALDATGAVLGSSATTGYLQTGTNQRTTPYLLPAGTKTARLKVQVTSDAGTGVPLVNKIVMFQRATLATAATSGALTSLVYTEGDEWVDILGPTHQIQFEREPLDISTLQATIFDATLDPSVSDTIRPGAKVRVRLNTEDDLGNSVWESLYSGTVSDADVNYERDQSSYVPPWTEEIYDSVDVPATNAILNPSFEGTSSLPGDLVGGTVARSSTWASSGAYSLEYTSTATTGNHRFRFLNSLSGTVGDKLSARVRVKATQACRVSLEMWSDGPDIETYLDFAAGEEKTISITDAPCPVTDSTVWLYVFIWKPGTQTNLDQTGLVAAFDEVCFYNSGSVTTGFGEAAYFDGDNGGTWTGTANNSTSTKTLATTTVTVIEHPGIPTTGDPKKTRITLSAVDNLTALANVNESRSVASVADLPMLLENTTVPYRVNGSGSQVPTATVVAINDDATLLDQIGLARDTDSGYVHVDRNGVLVANDPENVPTAVVGVLDETAYSDVDGTFSTKTLINSVVIKWLRYDSTTNEVTEIIYGPYEDLDSIAEWGLVSEEFTMAGIIENPTAIEARATAILAANSVPGKRVNSMVVPIRNAEDLVRGKALLDIYDLTNVKHTRTGTDDLARVTQITHTITATRSGCDWTMTVGFNEDGTVARPVALPAPVTYADIAGLASELPGAINLNDLDKPGSYAQSQNAEAVTGSNYPVAQAGLLEVSANSDQSMIWQQYRVYNGGSYAGQTFTRTRYNGTWSAWKAAGSETLPFGGRSGASTQSIPNITGTKVTLMTVDEGSQGGVTWNATNSEFTVTKAGIYMVHGRVAWTVNATGLRLIYLNVNGIAKSLISNNGSVGSGQSLTVPMMLAVNDKVTLTCYQSSGAALNLINNAGNCGLSLAYLGT